MLVQKTTPFNPDQNPFEFLINGQSAPRGMGASPLGSGAPISGQPQDMSQGGMGEGMMNGGMSAGSGQNIPEALQPGKTGDATKPLLGAIQMLHGFIAASQDPEEINMVRQIVSLLTNLIQRDQQRSSDMMNQAMQGGGQPQTAPLQGTPSQANSQQAGSQQPQQ